MMNIARRICLFCTALLVTMPLAATERVQTSTVKFVYPLASGDFVVGLDSDSSYCT